VNTAFGYLSSYLYNLFSDDEKAFFILMGKLEGQSAEEICQNEGIDHTTYATALRRIRRKIERSQTGKSYEQTV